LFGAGTLFPDGAPDFTLVLEWVSCFSILVFSVYYFVKENRQYNGQKKTNKKTMVNKIIHRKH
jgi:hypothetical protein